MDEAKLELHKTMQYQDNINIPLLVCLAHAHARAHAHAHARGHVHVHAHAHASLCNYKMMQCQDTPHLVLQFKHKQV